MTARLARGRAPVRRVRRGPGDERGSSTVEMVILFPLVVTLLLGGTQAAVWIYGRLAAQSAAAAGARAASGLGAPATAGPDAAEAFLASSGGGLKAVSVAEADDPDRVTVTVTGTVALVIPFPGLTPRVTASASRPVERFTAAGAP